MEPNIYFFKDHGINHNLIDPDALFVVNKLRDAGFTSYLVGGCVRDILANEKPKDFDISTAALPEQIKHIFKRNCLLIGRRFRLAHIRIGKKVFEVSTFRTGKVEDSELIVRDNEWGSPQEDALRRDFSINGLFYDPRHQTVIDYVNGWEDLKEGIIRSIGNPETRFKQDPVRMIRLLKFQARFDWKIDPGCLEALKHCREEIVKSAPARILEELLRMLESGHAHDFMRLLTQHDLLELLIPKINEFLKGPHSEEIFSFLKTIDEIHLRNPNVTLERPLLIACLFFPIVHKEVQKKFIDREKPPNLGELTILVGSVIRDILMSSFIHFPKKLSAIANYLIMTQYRLTPLGMKKKTRYKFLHDNDFPLALKFLKVRALIDKNLAESYFSWEQMHKKIRHHHPDKKPKYVTKRKRKPRGQRGGRSR